MKRFLTIAALIFLSKLPAQNWKTEDQYIQKFALYAVEEMEKYKIPASITLAQGLIETGGGQSRLAREGNNHFGIKCKNDWTGKTMFHTDDAPNECFRVYDDPRQSYDDHSKFLAYREYYKNLFTLDPQDYKAWAYGLKKAGYATEPRYPAMLINKIEQYRLYEFDKVTAKQALYAVLKLYPELQSDKIFMAQLEQSKAATKPVTVKVPYRQTSYAEQRKTVEKLKSDKELLSNILVKNHPNGNLRFIIVPADTDIDFIAKRFDLKAAKLKKWNELDSDNLKRNDILFLEPKLGSGNTETYKAQVGESMHDISQKFGVKLSKLLSRNRMDTSEMPRVGQEIYLAGKKPRH